MNLIAWKRQMIFFKLLPLLFTCSVHIKRLGQSTIAKKRIQKESKWFSKSLQKPFNISKNKFLKSLEKWSQDEQGQRRGWLSLGQRIDLDWKQCPLISLKTLYRLFGRQCRRGLLLSTNESNKLMEIYFKEEHCAWKTIDKSWCRQGLAIN